MAKLVTMTYRNELLRRAKIQTEMTDSAIADEAGVSRPTVIAILNGDENVNLKSLKAVAKALGVPMHELFAKAA